MSQVVLEDTKEYQRFVAEIVAWRTAQGDRISAPGFARCAAGNYFGLWNYTFSEWEAAGSP